MASGQNYSRGRLRRSLVLGLAGTALVTAVVGAVVVWAVTGTLGSTAHGVAIAGVLTAAVASGIGWVVGGRVTEHITHLTDLVQSIERSGSLQRRADLRGDDETAELGAAVNDMLDALAEKTATLIRRERDAQEAHRSTTRLIVSGLAHQINNPLSGMIDCVQELRLEDLDTESRLLYVDLLGQGLDRIHNVTARMARLDLAAVDNDCCTEVEPAVRSVLGLRNVQIERKAIRLKVTADAWVTVRVDPNVLCDIVDNLLSNAIEASHHGGTIRISITQKSRSEIEMRVVDQGVGIEEGEISRVFDPFYSKSSTGVGLGLWTVRAYLDGLGGAVDVDSIPGRGTTFRVILPSAAPDGLEENR